MKTHLLVFFFKKQQYIWNLYKPHFLYFHVWWFLVQIFACQGTWRSIRQSERAMTGGSRPSITTPSMSLRGLWLCTRKVLFFSPCLLVLICFWKFCNLYFCLAKYLLWIGLWFLVSWILDLHSIWLKEKNVNILNLILNTYWFDIIKKKGIMPLGSVMQLLGSV